MVGVGVAGLATAITSQSFSKASTSRSAGTAGGPAFPGGVGMEARGVPSRRRRRRRAGDQFSFSPPMGSFFEGE